MSLINKVVEFLKSENRYLPKYRIAKAMKIPMSRLMDVDTDMLCLSLGFKKQIVLDRPSGTKYNKEETITKIRLCVRQEKRPIPRRELSRLIGVPKDYLLRLQIDIDALYKEEGYPRKIINSKIKSLYNEDIRLEFINSYREAISRAGKSISLYSHAKSLGLSFSRYYRWNLNVLEIHKEAGVEYNVYDWCITTTEMEEKLHSLIKSRCRYITRDELAYEFNLSGSTVSLRKIPVEFINLKYGYTSKNKGFETRVGELLIELLPTYKIQYQKTFDDCKHKGKLIFDYFIEELNLLIEVDGEQHYTKSSMWYSEDALLRDNIKNNYAKQVGFTLVRIRSKNGSMSKHKLQSIIGEALKAKHRVIRSQAPVGEGSETSLTT